MVKKKMCFGVIKSRCFKQHFFMRVYFACSSTDLGKYIGHYSAIVDYVISLGFEIPHNWLSKVSERMRDSNYDPKYHNLEKAEMQKEGIKAIKESNALIADLSMPSASVGYQVSVAIEHGLPVLCLYSIDFGLKKLPQVIGSIDSSLLEVSSYTGSNYKKVIRNFLKKEKRKELVKFNFIATREIVEYLGWLSKKLRTTKSAALRSEIEEKLMRFNKEYKEFLKDKH